MYLMIIFLASCYFFGPGLTIRGADYRRGSLTEFHLKPTIKRIIEINIQTFSINISEYKYWQLMNYIDYGLSQGQCAKICKSDSCCMGFEWQKELTTCTLKSRSLNGTVTTVTDDVYFGICLDYGNYSPNKFILCLIKCVGSALQKSNGERFIYSP